MNTGTNSLIGAAELNTISGGTAWATLSDSNAQTTVKSVDPRGVLVKIEQLPVKEWEYKHDPHRRYFGPSKAFCRK